MSAETGAASAASPTAPAVPAPAVPLPPAAVPAPVARGRDVVRPLALQEARRVLRHPVGLLGWAVLAVNAVANIALDYGPRSAYETVDTLMSFYPGMMLVLVGSLVASRDRHAGTDELLASLPTRADRRTAALLLAALAPAAVGLVAVAAIHAANLALDRYQVAPGAGALLQGPLTLAGAVLLGVLTARWFRARVAVVLVLVAVVAANVWVNTLEVGQYFGPMMGWARWGLLAESWGGLFPGSPGWRLGYLSGLCLLAALGAMLPVVRRPVPVVAAGVVALAATAACGWAMLP